MLRKWRASALHGVAALTLVWTFLITPAIAEPLMRSSCWTWSTQAGENRILCFVASGRVKMTNRSRTVDDKGWSTCEWSGQYKQTGHKVTAAFAPSSGKCSNGAASPQYAVTCDFPGDRLDCRSSSLVGGKLLEFDRTFR
jgi:hypothetical protein